jgi:hypothetical protein
MKSKIFKSSTIILLASFFVHSEVSAKPCKGWLEFNDLSSVLRIIEKGYTKENDNKWYDAEDTEDNENKIINLFNTTGFKRIVLIPYKLDQQNDNKCTYELLVDDQEIAAVKVARYDSEPEINNHNPISVLILGVIKNAFEKIKGLKKSFPSLSNAVAEKTPIVLKKGGDTINAIMKLVFAIQNQNNEEITNNINDIIENVGEISVELFEDNKNTE